MRNIFYILWVLKIESGDVEIELRLMFNGVGGFAPGIQEGVHFLPSVSVTLASAVIAYN